MTQRWTKIPNRFGLQCIVVNKYLPRSTPYAKAATVEYTLRNLLIQALRWYFEKMVIHIKCRQTKNSYRTEGFVGRKIRKKTQDLGNSQNIADRGHKNHTLNKRKRYRKQTISVRLITLS